MRDESHEGISVFPMGIFQHTDGDVKKRSTLRLA